MKLLWWMLAVLLLKVQTEALVTEVITTSQLSYQVNRTSLITFLLWGGGGGGSSFGSKSANGGPGGYVYATITVNPGTYGIGIGRGGEQGVAGAGGAGGTGPGGFVGGTGGDNAGTGGGGGGGGGATTFTGLVAPGVADIVAPGGGGAGNHYDNGVTGVGGNGGSGVGVDGENGSSGAQGGSGATPAVAGGGGTNESGGGPGGGGPGDNGAGGAGGDAVGAPVLSAGGGGGGAGLFGGGGGGSDGGSQTNGGSGGGGGGSCLFPGLPASGACMVGSNHLPAGMAEPGYTNNAGVGGVGAQDGFDGLVVLRIVVTCSVDNDCDIGQVCIAGECSLPSNPGGPCDPGDPGDCIGAINCAPSGICGDVNAQCDGSNLFCNSPLVCIFNTCSPQGNPGDLCDPFDDADCAGAVECPGTGICGNPGADCTTNDDSLCNTAGEIVCISNVCMIESKLGGQCEDPTDCSGPVDCGSGICGGLTADCSINQENECIGSLSCIGNACTAQSPAGGPCEDDSDCTPPYTCGTFGICGSEGSLCSQNTDCSVGYTCLGSVCLSPSGAGGQCDLNDSQDCAGAIECAGTICGGDGADCTPNNAALCDPNIVCIGDTCTSFSNVGQPCDLTDDADCLSSVACGTDGICGGQNALCGKNDQCSEVHGLSCINGVCVPFAGIADTCDADDAGDCSGQLDCSQDLGGGLGACGDLNADCSFNNDNLCDPPLVCIQDLCSAAGNIPDFCVEDADCLGTVGCSPLNQCGEQFASCSANTDCNSGLSCIFSVCQPVSPLGGACDLSDNGDCAAGIFCGTDGICGGSGATCPTGSDTECHSALLLVCVLNTCSVTQSIGSACGEDADCTGGIGCGTGNICGALQASCLDNSDCFPGDTCIALECQPTSALFGDCDQSDDCAAGLECSALTCLIPNGLACTDNSECVNTCIGGFCAPSSDVGGSCDQIDDCLTPLACSGGTCYRAAGQACLSDGECVTSSCIANLCYASFMGVGPQGVHFFYVVGPPNQVGTLSFGAAKSLAEQKAFPGGDTANGECYLAVLNSASDQNTVETIIGGLPLPPPADLWFGASESTPGDWLWTCPAPCSQNGETFWTGGVGGSAVNGLFNNWASGEPVSGACAQVDQTTYEWNSADCSAASGWFLVECGKLVNLSHQYCVCSNAEEIMGTVSPQPTGAACTYNEDCTGSCIQLQCAPLASLGAACDAADDADCALIDGEIVSCPTDGLCGSFGASCTSSDTCAGSIACGTDNVCGGTGSSCATNNASLCQSTHVCIDDQCAVQSSLFGSCDPGQQSDCQPPLDCSTGGQCLLPNSHPCGDNSQCINVCIGLSCNDQSTTGGSCDETADCLAGAGLVCDNGTCLRLDGQPCTLNAECANTCRTLVCEQLSNLHEPCDSGDNADCTGGTECFATTCLFPTNYIGCADNTECEDVCIGGVCTTISSVNGPCDDTGDCQTGLGLACDNGECLGATGAGCGDNDECIATCIGSTCQVFSDVNQGCDPGDDTDCINPLVCAASGECLYLDGSSCSSNSECVGVCINNECSVQSLLLGDCDETADCASTNVCDQGFCRLLNLEVCTDNEECINTCINSECGNLGNLDDTCDPNDGQDCQSTIDCGTDGNCGGSGADCSSNSDSLCGSGLICIFNQCNSPSNFGGSCEEDSDCVNTVGCGQNNLCGSAGAPCANDNSLCDVGLTCISNFCAPVSSSGGACDDADAQDCTGTYDCGDDGTCGGVGADCSNNDDGRCSSSFICINDECGYPRQNTESCAENEDCVSLSCVTGTCQAVIGVGFPCDDNQDCGLTGSIACSLGVCGAQGADCSSNDDSKCLNELRCINDVCSSLGGISDACEDDSDCVSGRCIFGQCSSVSGLNQSCDSNPDCAVGLSCSISQSVCGGTDAICLNNQDSSCIAPLVCVEGLCQTLTLNNDPCAENADCNSSVCLNGLCAASPSGTGGPCDLFDDQDCTFNVDCAELTCGGSGATCVNNNDILCESTLRCIDTMCLSPSPVHGPCDGDDSDCSASLVCIRDKCENKSPVGGTCDANDNSDCVLANCNNQGVCGGVGSDCSLDSSCSTSLVCVIDECSSLRLNGQGCGENADCVNVCVGGTCQAASETGEPCDEEADCSGNLSCGADFVCGGNQAACPGNDDELCDTPGVICLPGDLCGEPLLNESPCNDNNDCVHTCVSAKCTSVSNLGQGCDIGDNSDCLQDVSCSPHGICGGPGAVCSNNDDSACLSGTVCVLGFCNSPQPVASACGDNADCLNTCIGGECQLPHAVGGPCDPNDASDCQGEIDCGDASQAVCGGSGAACDGTNTNCLELGNLVCIEGVCHGMGGLGDACDSNDDCTSGVCYDEKCANPASLGDGCDVSDGPVDCQAPLDCGDDGVCGGDAAECKNNDNSLCTSSRYCIAGLCRDIAPNDADCDGDNEECESGHCINLQCANASTVGGNCDASDNSDCAGVGCGLDLTCGGPGAEGCGNQDSLCVGPLVCSNDICSAKIELGDECDGDNSDCDSNQCIQGICAIAMGPGAPCDVGDDSDCLPGIFCGNNGVCGGTEASCATNDNSRCDQGSGLVCISNRCSQPSGNGGVCDDNSDCTNGNTCVSNVCILPQPLGGNCNDNMDCSNDINCSPSGICGGKAATCSSNDDSLCNNLICVDGACSSLVLRTGHCSENSDCASGVCIFSFCGISGTLGSACDEKSDCVAPLDCSADNECGGLGASCSQNNDAYCAGGKRCIEGVCQEPLAQGELCLEDGDCQSSVCVGGTCLSQPSTVSGPCDVGDDSDCASPLHCGSDGVCGGNEAACQTNNDLFCASPRVCVIDSCQQPMGTGATCEEADDCAQRCIFGQCAPPQQVGGACQSPDDCQGLVGCSNDVCGGEGSSCEDDVMCAPAFFCFSHTCEAKQRNSAACSANVECLSGTCIGGVCTEQSPLGGECDISDIDDCIGHLVCGADGTCGSVGATCLNDNNVFCQADLVCIGGFCSEKNGKGGRCESDNDCLSNQCFDSQCVANAKIGENCDSADDCIGDLDCADGICGGNGAQCSSNADCIGTCFISVCGPFRQLGEQCFMNENCLGTINCSPDGICGGNGAPCSSDEDCEQSCQAGRCVETQAGLDDTGNDGHGLDPEEEALLRDLETLTLLVTDLSASDVSSEAAQKKVEEAVALFASIVASTNIDATEFFTQLSKDAALLTSSTTILSEENANSLSTSLETLAESFTDLQGVEESVEDGGMSSYLTAVSNLIGGFTNSPIVVINSVQSIDEITQSVGQILIGSDAAISFSADSFFITVEHPGGSFLKREAVDECSSVISRSDIQKLVAQYGRRGVALTQVDYNFNVYQGIGATSIDSSVQGIDLRFSQDGSPVDVSKGILVSIPISPADLRELDDDDVPECVFFDPAVQDWRSDGMKFVRWGNDLDPRGLVKPQCIICNTTHFTDFGALFSGAGGGARGDGNSSNADENNGFGDTTFLIIFIVSWVLFGLIVILAVILVIVFDRVEVINDFMTGKTSRERLMKKRKLKVEDWTGHADDYDAFQNTTSQEMQL